MRGATLAELVRVYSAHDGSRWCLSVNGRELMSHETFAVVDGVREDLQGNSLGTSELCEVADSIRAAWEREPW